MVDLVGGLGDIADRLMGVSVLIVFILTVAGGLGYAYLTGLLARRPYKLEILIPKGQGIPENTHARGRFLKDGKFEVFYGINDKVVMDAPSEDLIGPNKTIYLIRESRDSHFPTVPKVNMSGITMDPTITNAGKLALAQELKNNVHRFANDPWQKYAMPISVIMGFMIVAIAWYVSTGQITEQMGEVADKFGAVADTLKDAKIILEKPPEAPPG